MSRQLRRTITPAVNPHKKPTVRYRRALCFFRRAIADAVWPQMAAMAATATNRKIACGTM
jgi:transposase